MALTQDDIDALDFAIVQGELTVEIDGRKVTMRSIDELKKARRHAVYVVAKKAGKKSGPLGPSFVVQGKRGLR
jgi:hypothetical protein